jgi:hypothetical protein
MSNDLPNEVLIYVQKIKLFFEKDKISKEYFLKNVDNELFFKYFTEISVKNFEELGTPELTIEQLEILNKTIRAICATKEPEYFTYDIWWNIGKYGKLCLN